MMAGRVVFAGLRSADASGNGGHFTPPVAVLAYVEACRKMEGQYIVLLQHNKLDSKVTLHLQVTYTEAFSLATDIRDRNAVHHACRLQ